MSKQYHQKLVNKYGRGKALSIIAHKLARATYYILKRREPFNYDAFYSAKLGEVHERDVITWLAGIYDDFNYLELMIPLIIL